MEKRKSFISTITGTQFVYPCDTKAHWTRPSLSIVYSVVFHMKAFSPNYYTATHMLKNMRSNKNEDKMNIIEAVVKKENFWYF